MAVPRRRSSAPVEVGKDTTNTKVVIPEGTKADIVEQKGGKTIAYQAEVIEDESKDQTNLFNGEDEREDIRSFINEPPAPVVPQSPLDKLFSEIIYCIEHQGVYDSFMAKLLRKPDNMNDRFNIPCRDLMEIGAFAFSSTDRFSFQKGIQDANDGSGGRFSVQIFKSDYKPLYCSNNKLDIEQLVVADLVIPNPKVQSVIDNNGGEAQPHGIGAVLLKMTEMMQANHNALMASLRHEPAKSEMETMVMTAFAQKMANDIINPQNNNNVDALQSTMVAMFSAPEMARKMMERAFPEPTPDREPTLIEQVREVLDIPVVKNAGETVMGVLEAAAVKGLKLSEQTPGEQTAADYQPQQPNPEQITMSEDQIELITTIVEELESENKLDGENETLKELAADFPDQFSDLIAMCKSGAPFEGVFGMLMNKAAKINPFPFQAYLNVSETQRTDSWVWNEQGEKIIERLKQLYEYLKTL